MSVSLGMLESLFSSSESVAFSSICSSDLDLVGGTFTRFSSSGSRSSIFAAPQTSVTSEGLVRVVSWYDNEWGFSNRMIDTAGVMAKFL